MPINRDERCVYVSDNFGRAEVVAAWLSGEGMPAEVMDEMTLGGFEGLTPWLPANVSARGIEVWVTRAEDAERARQFVADKQVELAATRNATAGPTETTCEECGTKMTFLPEEKGTVQECLQCGAYIDVPGDGETWDGIEGDEASEEE